MRTHVDEPQQARTAAATVARSTATVAVLETAARTGPALYWDDVDIDVFSGSGPGGQHRNKSEQCARLTHRPSGLVVVATASRSRRQNIMAAFAELQRRLAVAADDASAADRNQCRRTQIATGERPTKQWTWNDQRAEVVDHSTGTRYPNGRVPAGPIHSGQPTPIMILSRDAAASPWYRLV